MRHVWTISILTLLVALSGFIAGQAGLTWLDEPWFVGVGVMILMAYAAGEALRWVGLPALLGYILVGIGLGPSFAALMPVDYPLAVISTEVIEQLGLVQVLIIGLIGMLGGAKFHLQDVSGNTRLLITITLALLLTLVPLTMGSVLLAGQVFPDALGFLANQPFATQLTIALFFGVLAFGLAPSITIAMLQELRARGPLATVILGVVILTEFVLFALFAFFLALGRVVVGPETLEWGTVGAVLPGIMWQLLLSVVIGVLIGLATANYLRYVRRETLLFLLAVLVVGYFGVVALQAEPLLTFLVAGFFVQNASLQGESLVRMLERIALPLFVIYFAIVAASIDLEGAFAYLPLVVILVATRIAVLYAAIRWASRKAVETNRTYEYLRTAFISQDAVVLVLAGVVAVNFPDWGPAFQSVIIATVITYLLVGPVLLKLGLDRSGEARPTGYTGPVDEAELVTRQFVVPERTPLPSELLAKPKFEDAWLKGHIEDLREGVLEQSTLMLYEPVKQQYRSLHEGLRQLEALVEGQSGELDSLVEQVEAGADEQEITRLVRELQKEYARQVQPVIRTIERTRGLGVDAPALEELFTALRGLEDKDSLYRIEREATLLEQREGDSPWVRFVKTGRRLRVRITGRGYRTVPVGRLWRYYVELAVSTALVKTAPPALVHYESFWKSLWRHLRRLDNFWEELIAEITVLEHGDVSGHERAARVRRHIEAFLSEFNEEQTTLERQAKESITLVMACLATPIARAFNQFVAAAARAGTSRLPAFSYRPSSRFGQSRRSENRLLDRIQRSEGIVSGYRGWIRLDHELSSFGQWTRLFATQIEDTVGRALGEDWQEALEELANSCRTDANLLRAAEGDAAASEDVYREELRPKIATFRQRQEELLARLHKGVATRSLQTRLEARIFRVPQTVSVLAGEPERVVLTSASSHYELPLRHWLASQVGREMALRIVEFNERAEEQIERRLALLSSVEQVLELNLVTAYRESAETPEGQDLNEVASAGLERAAALVESYLNDVLPRSEELQDWLPDELNTIVARAFEPLMARRLGEVQRELARLEAASFVARSESWLSDSLEPLTIRLQQARARIAAFVDELGSEVRSVLLDRSREVDRFDIRKILFAAEPAAHSEAPSIYRRLFVPMPLDIPEFYRHRDLEEDRFLETVREFFQGAEHAILITGPTGVGKRTFVHHLLPGRVQAVEGLSADQLVSIKLDPSARDEAHLTQRLAQAICDTSNVKDFKGLRRCLTRSGGRKIVVLEHAENLVLRTEEGIELARRFFALLEATSGSVLWVVLLSDGARTFLDTHLDLQAHFTHCQRLTGMSAEELEAMIMARHQVSGFQVEFDQPRLRRLERMRRPVFGAQARLIPRRVFFERLAFRSGGNPRAALLYWLKAVQVDPVDESRIRVQSLAERNVLLLAPLSLRQRLLLATLSLHRTISLDDMARVLDEDVAEISRDIRHLKRLGFVEIVPETQQDFCIRPLASAWVERELRALNLI